MSNRTCGVCGAADHDRRNCPSLSVPGIHEAGVFKGHPMLEIVPPSGGRTIRMSVRKLQRVTEALLEPGMIDFVLGLDAPALKAAAKPQDPADAQHEAAMRGLIFGPPSRPGGPPSVRSAAPQRRPQRRPAPPRPQRPQRPALPPAPNANARLDRLEAMIARLAERL